MTVRPSNFDDGPNRSGEHFGGISTTGILKYDSPTGSFQDRRQILTLSRFDDSKGSNFGVLSLSFKGSEGGVSSHSGNQFWPGPGRGLVLVRLGPLSRGLALIDGSIYKWHHL